MKVQKALVNYNLSTWELSGQPVQKSEKFLNQVTDIYENISGYNLEDLVYTVYVYAEEDTLPGHVQFGVSILEPRQFNGEFNMTKGHKHEDTSCSEVYWGIDGEGLLILEMEEETKIEQVTPGSVHYIKGSWAHRLVNTGSTKLIVGAAWSSMAGHDYNVVFKNRVFDRNGVVIV